MRNIFLFVTYSAVGCGIAIPQSLPKATKSASAGIQSSYANATRIDSPFREARNRLFNGAASRKVRGNSVYEINETLSESSGPLDLWRGRGEAEAFPVRSSEAIVICRVVGGSAYLSQDKTTIYSEHKAQILDVIKDSTGVARPNTVQSVARAGGMLILDSGKTVIQAADNESHPSSPQSRFLLFLNYDRTTGLFLIRTGYEIAGDRIFCMDRIRPNRELREYETPEKNVMWEIRQIVNAAR